MTTPKTNSAAWLVEHKAPLQVKEAPYPTPGPGEVVVKVKAVAFNPVDHAEQTVDALASMYIKQYPAILGIDVAGEIEAAGAGMAYTPGDRVVAYAKPFDFGDAKYGALQEYCVVRPPLLQKIPASVDFAHACVFPLTTFTACNSLFEPANLGLVMPPGKGAGTVLVWGGASSVGTNTVQLARAAGYKVVTTASNKNFEYCAGLGAAVYDYHDADVVDQIAAHLQGHDVVGAVCAISDVAAVQACLDILAKVPDSRRHVAAVMPGYESLEWRHGTVSTYYSLDMAGSLVERLWATWLYGALEDGTFAGKPEPLVVGKGLGAAQLALDTVAGGVSARKVVIEL